tara:strand:+ start:193 stop:888 length:696 start_codon:yes stop_codon:yes gene_type:complete
MTKLTDSETVLSHLINQLQYSEKIDKIIIATTTKHEDDVILSFAKENKINIFRGDSSDVLDRYYKCAKEFSCSSIVRITSDNPLIDPKIIDKVAHEFEKKSVDYISNCNPRTYPYGTEVEIFLFSALEKAWKNAKKPSEREHVTPYFHNNKDEFKISNIEFTENLSHLRWTVDKENDLKFVKKIISEIKNRPILMQDIIKLITKKPEILDINKNHIPNEGYLKSLNEDKYY